LTISSTERKISGSYFYKSDPDKISISGELYRSDSLILNEFDRTGNLTGTFKGKFKNPSRIEGVWSKPNGSNPASFYLNETNFKYEGLLLEATAKHDSVERQMLDKKVVEETEKQSLEKIEKDKKAMYDKISDFLIVTHSKFKVKKIKGISDLKISLKNNSIYVFDRIVVEVNYLNKKGETVNTQTTEYLNLEPEGMQTKLMPESNRGISVKYSIRKAISSKIQFSYK